MLNGGGLLAPFAAISPMTPDKRVLARRDFLKTTALAGAGLGCIGLALPRKLGVPPLRAAPAKLAIRNFNMLVLGDSYAWQPGLLKQEKSFSLVAGQIADALAGFRIVNTPRYFARSGADIGDEDYGAPYIDLDNAAPWPGAVPDGWWDDPSPNGNADYAAPSVWRQMTRAMMPTTPVPLPGPVPSPAQVDLIILSGGGNDVGVAHAVSPFEFANDHQNVRQRIQDFCGGRMKRLLPKLVTNFPNARIVVTGYPQIFSQSSNSLELGKYLQILNLITLGPATDVILASVYKPAAIDASRVFAEETSKALQSAVNDANTLTGEPRRVVFADVRPFWPEVSAYGAPYSFFWHLTVPLNPPDHTVDQRKPFCLSHPDAALNTLGVLKCAHGAMGHPNVEGAKAYAAAIGKALDGFGVGWLGLKAMNVCADAVVIAEPKPVAYARSDVAEPPPNLTLSDETFSITLSTRDAAENAPLTTATADVGGKPVALGAAIPLTPCKTSRPSRITTGSLNFVNVCATTVVTVRAPGYAKVSFAVADIFDGEIPGSGQAGPAPVGKAFHFCAPVTTVGALFVDAPNAPPPPVPASTPAPVLPLVVTVRGQGREGKKMPMQWWVIVTTTDGAGKPRKPGADAVSINGVHGLTGNKITFNVCGGTEPGPCIGTVKADGFPPVTFTAGPEK